MDYIKYLDPETNEEDTLVLLSVVEHKGTMYIMVSEEEELYNEEINVFVLEAKEDDGENIIYEEVLDDKLLDELMPLLEDNIEFEMFEEEYKD